MGDDVRVPDTNDAVEQVTRETVTEFKNSFSYGSRSNLDFKFLARLSDEDATRFFVEMLAEMSSTVDTGDDQQLAALALQWQQRTYGASGNVQFPYDDVPRATLDKPLAEARIALLTSSGHFVDGDDPQPFGVVDMTQAEAEARIGEFLKVAPTLSTIPIDTPPERLRVRHGGYPVAATIRDHNVNLPTRPLSELAASGLIGEVVPTAYSFVGATAQTRLRDSVAPQWAEMLCAEAVDAVLLVPV